MRMWKPWIACVCLGAGVVLASPVSAQGRIELDVIQIETDVPRRVAQFFVQRDRLHYQPEDERPSFLDDLLRSVEEDPF